METWGVAMALLKWPAPPSALFGSNRGPPTLVRITWVCPWLSKYVTKRVGNQDFKTKGILLLMYVINEMGKIGVENNVARAVVLREEINYHISDLLANLYGSNLESSKHICSFFQFIKSPKIQKMSFE